MFGLKPTLVTQIPPITLTKPLKLLLSQLVQISHLMVRSLLLFKSTPFYSHV